MPFNKGQNGGGCQPLNLSESQIRYAMSNSQSNNGAARFLGITNQTYKKYASLYIDVESSKTLYDLHKNQACKGMSKVVKSVKRGIQLSEILEGLHPSYPVQWLKRRLMKNNNILPCQCFKCGLDERRVTDDKIPLLLDFIDGNKNNHKKENLQWLCYNCMFLSGNWNPTGGRKSLYVYMA